jgi:arsenate reductase
MRTIRVYQYAACGTCQKAMKWLKAQQIAFEAIPIVEQPPTAAQLKEFLDLSGLDVKKLFNTSGVVYKEQGIKNLLPTMNEAEMLALLASNGKLIKRPIVTDGNKATVGYHEATFASTWGN